MSLLCLLTYEILRLDNCVKNSIRKASYYFTQTKNSSWYEGPILNDLKSLMVYNFTCASCSSICIDKGWYHSETKIKKHIKDNKSHIFKQLHSNNVLTCITISPLK